jgi:hypothetical protein
MRRRRKTDLIGLGILSVLLLNCSGGAMSETESDSVSTASAEPSQQPTDAPDQATAAADEAADVDDASYRDALAESILSTWTQPRRANNTPPRIAVVTVYLGPYGRLIRWEWRRRSPVGRYNDLVTEYLDELVSSPRQFPLPPEGSPLWVEVLEQGVAIEFADSDA